MVNELRQLPSVTSLENKQGGSGPPQILVDEEASGIELNQPMIIPTTSTSSLEQPVVANSGVSTSTATKHAKENLMHKAKRMKKSQALIQSKIVT